MNNITEEPLSVTFLSVVWKEIKATVKYWCCGKEEKENKNKDSRNGKAIPGQGESGFRDGAANNPNKISMGTKKNDRAKLTRKVHFNSFTQGN